MRVVLKLSIALATPPLLWALALPLAPAGSDIVLGVRAAFVARFGTHDQVDALVNNVRQDMFGRDEDAPDRPILRPYRERLKFLMREGLSFEQAMRQISLEANGNESFAQAAPDSGRTMSER